MYDQELTLNQDKQVSNEHVEFLQMIRRNKISVKITQVAILIIFFVRNLGIGCQLGDY